MWDGFGNKCEGYGYIECYTSRLAQNVCVSQRFEKLTCSRDLRDLLG